MILSSGVKECRVLARRMKITPPFSVAGEKKLQWPLAKTLEIPVVGRSAHHSTRAPSGAVWSSGLPHNA